MRVFDVRTFADLLTPLEPREICEVDPYTTSTERTCNGDPPEPEIMRAIEVAIAGRFSALLVAHADALGDWRGYAAAILPPRTPDQAREGAARASVYPRWHGSTCDAGALSDDLTSPVGAVTSKTNHKTLRTRHGDEHPQRRLGDVARIHRGLVMLERVDDIVEKTVRYVGDIIARGGEFFSGECFETRMALVATMAPCSCTLRRCWCPPAELGATRLRVRRGLPRIDVFGVPGWWSRPIFMAPPAARARIVRAWQRQDAELGAGARYGDLAPSSDTVAKVIALLDDGASSSSDHEAQILTRVPW